MTAVIFILGLKHFKKDNIYALKFLAVTILMLEIFKFFYNASTFARGTTPAQYLPLTIVTLISVAAMFGAFKSDGSKLGAPMRSLVVLTALVPLILVAFNDTAWYRPHDMTEGVQIGMVAAIYFVQCGLILAYAHFAFKKKSLVAMCIAAGFVAATLLLVMVTNHLWETEFVFTEEAIENVIVIVLSFLSIAAIWGLSVLFSKNKEAA